MQRLTLALLLYGLVLLPYCTNAQANAEEHVSFFTSFDKTRIAFTDEGEGVPILLLHGFISSGNSWNKSVLKRELLTKGYRVIVPDLRGNGLSDKPVSAEAYRNDAEIKDLKALIDHLKLPELYALGYSRGSIVLAKLLTQEDRISKAILGGMGIDFTNPDWARRIAFADAFSGRAAPDALTSGAVKYATSIGANLTILGLLQDHQPVTSIAALNQLSVETLILAGDADTDNGDPALLRDAIPNSEFILVEGDHNNTYKQENFALAVLTFLAR